MEDTIEVLKRFLYDEGPHTTSGLARETGLSEYTVKEALSLMKLEGAADFFHRPENGRQTLYWMYAGEELEEATA